MPEAGKALHIQAQATVGQRLSRTKPLLARWTHQSAVGDATSWLVRPTLALAGIG
jgi:hypothetical protein